MFISNRKLKIYIILILILLTAFTAHAAAVTVSVDALEYVSGSNFDVEIKIDNVEDLDSGQFDIVINSSVITVTNPDDNIENGEIEDKEISIENYLFIDDNILRLLFNLPGVDGVSGSGTLATIKFEVVGTEGDTSYLNLSNGLLVDTESEKITATWEGTMVTIGEQSGGTSATSTINLYVKNIDDDKLDVHLLIDGIDEGFKTISSKKTKEYGSFKLEEGVHTIKIMWFDPDTSKWYEKIEEITITDTSTIILTTDDHDEDEDKISAHVYVDSLDKDSLDVYLYIDGNYKKYLAVSSNKSVDFGEYEFEDDEESLHSFKLKWYDPSAKEEYEKTTRSYIISEEALTLIVDSHIEGGSMSVSDVGSTSVSTTPAVTATQSTESSTSDESQPAAGGEGVSDSDSTQAPIDSEQLDNSSGTNDLIHSFNNIFILVGFVAVLIALYQIRKV